MNAYVQDQTSGHNWTKPITTGAYRPDQTPVPISVPAPHASVFRQLEEQMLEFEAKHEIIVDEIAKYYVMQQNPSVRSFLRSHRGLTELLLEAVPHLRHEFGEDAVLSLRAPIDEGGSQTLYATVMWPGRVSDAKKALDRFDTDWWITHAGPRGVRLTFMYELA